MSKRFLISLAATAVATLMCVATVSTDASAAYRGRVAVVGVGGPGVYRGAVVRGPVVVRRGVGVGVGLGAAAVGAAAVGAAVGYGAYGYPYAYPAYPTYPAYPAYPVYPAPACGYYPYPPCY